VTLRFREIAVTENVWSKGLRWGPWRFVYYPKALFGADAGELYNLENDPNETTNLYRDAASQPIVVEGRIRLLDWLTSTSRYVSVGSVWPPPCRFKPWLKPGTYTLLAQAHKESNQIGIEDRIRHHELNYL
jgi:hypothetical protein